MSLGGQTAHIQKSPLPAPPSQPGSSQGEQSSPEKFPFKGVSVTTAQDAKETVYMAEKYLQGELRNIGCFAPAPLLGNFSASSWVKWDNACFHPPHRIPSLEQSRLAHGGNHSEKSRALPQIALLCGTQIPHALGKAYKLNPGFLQEIVQVEEIYTHFWLRHKLGFKYYWLFHVNRRPGVEGNTWGGEGRSCCWYRNPQLC